MGRWNFNNNADAVNNYKKLDTNPDHYKSKYDKPYKPSYHEPNGVQLHFIDGSTYRTSEFDVDDVFDTLHTKKERWLKLENGGEINLGYVTRYEPYSFRSRGRYENKY